MNRNLVPAVLAAAILCAPLCAAAAPKPSPLPTPQFQNKPLHARLIVEVNSKGQVVRVAHGDLSGDRDFDLVAIGNALQMWIRHPDGTAETGTYSVTYDYDPRTKRVMRHPSIVKAGGNWGNSPGAATLIVKDMERETQQAEARLKAEQMKKEEAHAKNLPDINAAVRRSMSKPSASPQP